MNLIEKVRPARTALLVVDVQRDYFCEGGIIDLMGFDWRAVAEILPALGRFVNEARETLDLVIFTRQTLSPHLAGC